MEGIEFDIDESQNTKNTSQHQKKQSFLFRLLAKIGVVDPTVANFIMIGAAAFFFGIAIFIYAGISENNSSPKLSAQEIAQGVKALTGMRAIQNY
jgi:hypothetical protein